VTVVQWLTFGAACGAVVATVLAAILVFTTDSRQARAATRAAQAATDTVEAGRDAARQLEDRSRREEVMRTLRWAAELAVSKDEDQAKLGLAQLSALGESQMLDEAQQLFIDAALEAVVSEPVSEIESAGENRAHVILGGFHGPGTLTASGVALFPRADEEGHDG
jgi:hypothetical protein